MYISRLNRSQTAKVKKHQGEIGHRARWFPPKNNIGVKIGKN